MSLGAFNPASATSPLEQKALAIMMDACPRLLTLKDAGELTSLTATTQPVVIDDERRMGWKRIVQITATLSEPAKTLPRDFYASGHTCLYDVGSGGVVTAKAPCKKLCDFDLSSNGAAYRSIPATRSLQFPVD